jgi:hypothetical protein
MRVLEGLQRVAGVVDRQQTRELGEIDCEPSRIEQLRHKTAVCQRGLIAMAETPG